MKKYLLCIIILFFCGLKGYFIPMERFELIDEKKDTITDYVGWIKTENPIGNEAVLVNIQNPQFKIENGHKQGIERGTVLFIVPQAARETLPDGLYYWKSKSEVEKPSIEYKKLPVAKKDVPLPSISAWPSDNGKPDAEYLLQKKLTTYWIEMRSSDVYQAIFRLSTQTDESRGGWKEKIPDFPSQAVEKLFPIEYPDKIEKVHSDVEKTVSNKLNVDEKDPVTQYTIQESIKESVDAGLPYVILRTTIRGGSNFYFYHFYSAVVQIINYNYTIILPKEDVTAKLPVWDITLYITYKKDDKYFYFLSKADIFTQNEFYLTPYECFIKFFLQHVLFQQKALDESEEPKIDLGLVNRVYVQALQKNPTAEEKKKIEEILTQYFAAQPDLEKKIKENRNLYSKLALLVSPPTLQEKITALENTVKNVASARFVEAILAYENIIDELKKIGLDADTAIIRVYSAVLKRYVKEGNYEAAQHGLLGIIAAQEEIKKMRKSWQQAGKNLNPLDVEVKNYEKMVEEVEKEIKKQQEIKAVADQIFLELQDIEGLPHNQAVEFMQRALQSLSVYGLDALKYKLQIYKVWLERYLNIKEFEQASSQLDAIDNAINKLMHEAMQQGKENEFQIAMNQLSFISTRLKLKEEMQLYFQEREIKKAVEKMEKETDQKLIFIAGQNLTDALSNYQILVGQLKKHGIDAYPKIIEVYNKTLQRLIDEPLPTSIPERFRPLVIEKEIAFIKREWRNIGKSALLIQHELAKMTELNQKLKEKIEREEERRSVAPRHLAELYQNFVEFTHKLKKLNDALRS